jgi:hypothetical protein
MCINKSKYKYVNIFHIQKYLCLHIYTYVYMPEDGLELSSGFCGESFVFFTEIGGFRGEFLGVGVL